MVDRKWVHAVICVTWASSVGFMSRRTGHLVRNDWCLGNSVILNFRSNERDSLGPRSAWTVWRGSYARTHALQTLRDKGCGTVKKVRRIRFLWNYCSCISGIRVWRKLGRRRDFIGDSIGECGVGNYVFAQKSRQWRGWSFNFPLEQCNYYRFYRGTFHYNY